MSNNSCQSCEVPAKVCERSRTNRAEACCTDCAMDALWVLHCMADPHDRDLAQVRARALVDGRLAAFADASDLTPLIANRSGLADPAGELTGIARDMPDGTARDVVLRVAAAIRVEQGDQA